MLSNISAVDSENLRFKGNDITLNLDKYNITGSTCTGIINLNLCNLTITGSGSVNVSSEKIGTDLDGYFFVLQGVKEK